MTNDRRSTFRYLRLAALSLALALLGSTSIASVVAQDASPEASPMAVACDSPGLPPGTPTPMDDMAMGEMDMATPMAVEEAEEDVLGTAADEATAAAIMAAIENYVACYNEGQATGDPGLYVALESSNYWESQGYATPWDYAASELESPFSSVELLGMSNAMSWDDGRVSADIEFVLGDYWYNHWRVFLVEQDGTWLWDQEAPLPPQPDVDFVSVNGINLTETTDEATGEVTYGFQSRSGSWDFVATDAIIFNITNTGVELHEAVVVQLPEGADPLGLLDGSVPSEDVTVLGGVFGLAPEQSADLTFLNLPAGTYTLLCFFPSPEGVPHAAQGMVQNFNIVEPAS